MRKKGAFMLEQSILRLRSANALLIFSSMIFNPLVAQADVIAERKANFKANAAAMKAIRAALGAGDFETVVTQATTIAQWAKVMPNYFPANSDVGDTKARPDIWMDFDAFKRSASKNEKAALELISIANKGDMSSTINAVKQLGVSCKSCHNNFKD
jgi:cytochrome c556